MKTKERKDNRRLNLFIRVWGLLTIILAVFAILGWILDISQLATFASGKIPMALSTAVLFAAYGLMIFFHNRLSSNRIMFRVEVAIGSAGFLAAILFLYLSMNGIRLGVEHLNMKMTGTVDGLIVGHMSPVTAFCFLLVGLSFFTMLAKAGQKKLIKTSFILAVLLFFISIILLLSYLLGTPLLYEGSFIPPALPTSLAFLFLGTALILISGLKVWSYEELTDVLSTRYTFILAFVFILLIVTIITAGYSYYKNYEIQFRSEIENQLSSIASLKINQIVQWRKERLEDAKIFYKNKAFSNLVMRYFQNKKDLEVEARIKSWIYNLQQSHITNQAALIDLHFNKKIIFPENEEPNISFINQDTELKLRSGEIVFQDFYFNEKHKKIFLKIIVPILDEEQGKNLIGILALRIDPQQFLNPFIKEWPTPSKTAETFIVRREGNEVVFLNELRFQKNTALRLRKPLTEINLPAARAALGKKEFMEGVDYRGISVFAYVCPIPNSPWFLVARIDVSEVYAPLRKWFWAIVILVAGLLIGSGASVGLIWRNQRSKFYDERYKSTENIRRLNRVYAVLSDINEAIVRIRNRQELFEKACDIAIEKGGLQMAWIGKINSQTRKIDLVASKGVTEVYLKKVDLNYEGDEHQLGIAGRVIKTGTHVISNDIQNDENILPLHKESVLYGSKSFGAFPLKVFGQVWGVFKLYSSEIGFFDEEELKLLDELAMDISFSIEFALKEDERRLAKEALTNSETRYRRLFESSKDGILILDSETGKIVDVNPFLIDLLGYSKEKFIEKEIWEIGFFKDIVANKDKFFELQRKGYVRYEDLPLETTNGKKINVEFVSNVYLVNNQKVIQCNIRDITERRRAEKELQESEEKFRIITENSADAIFITDKQGRYLYVNTKAVQMLGYSVEEMLLFTIADISPKNRLGEHYQILQQLLKGDSSASEIELVKKDGKIIPIDFNAVLLPNGFVYASCRDITDRRLAEEKLRESEELFRHSFDYAATGIFIIGIDQKFQKINNAFQKMIGYEEDEIKNFTFSDITHPDDLSIGLSQLKKMLDGEIDIASFEKRYIRKDKQIIWAYVSISLVRNANNQPQFFITQIIDITERKKSENELRKLSRAIEQSSASIIITNTEGNIEYINKKVTEISGYQSEEVIGRNPRIFSSGEKLKSEYKSLWDTITSGKEWRGEFHNKKKNGELYWEFVSISSILNEKGVITNYLAVKEDITQNKKDQEEISRMVNILEATPDLVGMAYPNGNIFYLNHGGKLLMEIPASEDITKLKVSSFHPEEIALLIIQKGLPIAKEEGFWSAETRILTRTGEEIPVLQSIISHKNSENVVTHYSTIIRDIRESKKMEVSLKKAKEKAEESDKLKTQFLAQMSHEIRTPINIMIGNVDYLSEACVEQMDADIRDCFEGINLASKRIIRTIDLILNASELQTSNYKTQFVKIDLNSEVLKKLYQEYQLSAQQKGLEIIYTCKEKEMNIIADLYSITQIFANLIDNATKYTKKGKVEIFLGRNKTGNIMVEVKDTGIGISKEFLPKMFDPFVQEEQGFIRSYDGNGLGLTLVKKYCELNNAIIEVESEKNVGTTFRIIFNN